MSLLNIIITYFVKYSVHFLSFLPFLGGGDEDLVAEVSFFRFAGALLVTLLDLNELDCD